ncbi:MAG: hypothetical protein U0559_01725 [Anaerolineae bacterium]
MNSSSNTLRQDTWTSADAAGLPILPGLVRYDESARIGEINHAIRSRIEYDSRLRVAARHQAAYNTKQFAAAGQRSLN